jgi:hypothetical protein
MADKKEEFEGIWQCHECPACDGGRLAVLGICPKCNGVGGLKMVK